ncbi:MAG: histidine kinase [Verrucomicrobia bacterium]|nr:histidine kinase [Verrucomicrobiota bacterium]
MSANSNTSAVAGELRRHAEAKLKERRKPAALPQTNADTKRLVHELQVHQVELELQNAELSRARTEAEANAEKFSDLYDFAPVGYFTFAEKGSILGVNLTGAALLGEQRQRLLNRRFQVWVAPDGVKGFNEFLKRTFGCGTRQTCEVKILKTGKACLPVQIEGCRVLNPDTEIQCRAVVVDLTERKRVEEEIRKLNVELETRVAARTAEISALLQASQQMQEQLRHLSHLVLRAQEEERQRISRELHDQVAQTLIGINLELMALTLEPVSKPRILKQQVARTRQWVEESVSTLHRFAMELRPTVLDDLGLIPALQTYVNDFTKRTGVRARLTAFARGKIGRLNSDKRTVLYRVTQAALTNVAQHAKASRATVIIHKYPGRVCLEIEDDGKGFRVTGESASKGHQHLGLLGMRERVEMVGGAFNLESTPGQGTTIRVEIPLDKGREEGRLKGTC